MSGFQDIAIQAAETLQTAHINKSPSIEHDVAPGTAADKKETVQLDDDPDVDAASDVEEDEIPASILRPTPRRPQMPPLPDLRFEQSYLASIKDTQSWQGVAYITIRDQVMMPLVQGIAWTLIVAGWRHWNKAARFSGQSVGAKIRRWWWGVNNWTLPDNAKGTLRDEKLAEGAAEFYTAEANAGSD
ncbi:hypothetical protein LTR37_000466 [Vermiconidia calcicola]|uniref:Uncharacterized protein n=1 Tax=Vermiconidia calcicola TaxID=1690605 RepID=A0ACC3P1F9_9PEZI|nr:hypothetical protein LTR37_000466 [Vermiconidia calcicola]